ncbi:MAG: sodium ion-translocating decarboxylase subunit beta [Eubacteriales bacterium]
MKMKKLIISLMSVVSLLTGCGRNQAVSIGIIGGADGPTSVFVAGKVYWGAIAAVASVSVLIIVLLVIYFIKRRK